MHFVFVPNHECFEVDYHGGIKFIEESKSLMVTFAAISFNDHTAGYS